ncbi:hypothetical protein ACFZBU_17790 [Embleya sp. NPDC008237]|uniref:hypothetical protein n=1 Tax=Embleya sp. NPDC008237 TaxID=3363978 RepID=UPI0036DFE304
MTLRYLDANGRLHDSMPAVAKLADKFKGATADPFAPASASDGLHDHGIDRYIAHLEKNLA